jgi:tetratricopeptide (TPR) repeat protein
VLGGQGDAQLQLGTEADAEKSYRESLEHLRTALRHDPDELAYSLQLALAHERLALLAERKGDRDEAQKQYREALRLRQDFLIIEPSNLTWQAACMRTLAHCGKEAEAVRKAEDLIRRRPKSVPLLLEVARCYSVCAGAADTPEAKKRHVERAVAALGTATAEGYRDAAALKTDPELAPLREDPAFQALLAELAKR